MYKNNVLIRGIGIVSTLGEGLQSNLDAMLNAPPPFSSDILNHFAGDPVTAPFLRSSITGRNAPEHLSLLVSSAVEEAISQTQLSSQERLNLPIFIGSSSYGMGIAEESYAEAIANGDPLAIPLNLDGFTQVSDHLRQNFGLRGADFSFNTACTASANALLSARQMMLAKNIRYALVVGVETRNLTTLAGFSGMQLLSKSAMRPFDRRRDGLILGEGAAALLLENTSDGFGVSLCGGASHCDTYSISASNPNGSRIADIMNEAMLGCEITTSNIIAIKAHGTASPLNDDAESAGMHLLFSNPPPIFSMKAYIGHTLGSCGAIETALMAGCLSRGYLPASGGFEEYDEQLGIRPLSHPTPCNNGHYMLNFFGFGGNNCSLILNRHCKDN